MLPGHAEDDDFRQLTASELQNLFHCLGFPMGRVQDVFLSELLGAARPATTPASCTGTGDTCRRHSAAAQQHQPTTPALFDATRTSFHTIQPATTTNVGDTTAALASVAALEQYVRCPDDLLRVLPGMTQLILSCQCAMHTSGAPLDPTIPELIGRLASIVVAHGNLAVWRHLAGPVAELLWASFESSFAAVVYQLLEAFAVRKRHASVTDMKTTVAELGLTASLFQRRPDLLHRIIALCNVALLESGDSAVVRVCRAISSTAGDLGLMTHALNVSATLMRLQSLQYTQDADDATLPQKHIDSDIRAAVVASASCTGIFSCLIKQHLLQRPQFLARLVVYVFCNPADDEAARNSIFSLFSETISGPALPSQLECVLGIWHDRPHLSLALVESALFQARQCAGAAIGCLRFLCLHSQHAPIAMDALEACICTLDPAISTEDGIMALMTLIEELRAMCQHDSTASDLATRLAALNARLETVLVAVCCGSGGFD